MGNFYTDNPDIADNLKALDLGEVAALLEEDFRFAKEFDFAPKDATDALDNYARALDVAGDIAGNRVAPTAEETDKVGNVLNDDGSVTYTPGTKLAMDLYGRTGLLGVQIPYALGGLNMPCTVLTAANDMVSRAEGALMNMFGLQGIAETINMFGDEEMKKRYVPRLVTGELTGAMVLTEPDAGSDLQSVKTAAYQDADGNWFVNGVKRFITNGCGDVLLVLARTEPEFSDGRGLSCLLVEKGPRVKVRRLEHKLGINGSPTCELVFDNAPAQLIGQRKRGLITYVMTLMNGARVGISAQGTGIGEAAYRAAREYAASRKQFGVTIDTFGPIRELLADMSVDVQASRALAYYASRCVDMETGLEKKFNALKGSPDAPYPPSEASCEAGAMRGAVRTRMKRFGAFNKMLTPMAKYFASEMSMRVSRDAISVLGGSGYMKDYPVERYYRDARITTIYEGTSQLQVIAAIAGVTGGLVRDVVAECLDGEIGEKVRSGEMGKRLAEIEKLNAELDAAIETAKAHPDGKSFLDLQARRLVDAGIAVVIGALFVRLAVKLESVAKERVLDHWIATRFPDVRAGLAKIAAGYTGALTDFETLAPAVPAE